MTKQPTFFMAFLSAILLTLSSCAPSTTSTRTPPPTTSSAGEVTPATASEACMPPFGVGFTSAFAEVNGQQIHYWIGGSGPALVLIHGYPENSYAWHEIAPELAATHTVIVPDLRGAGRSSKPETGYDVAQLADDIYQLVTSLGYNTVDLAGHDWGGAVATRYATDHPEQVRKLANLEAGPPAGFGQGAAQEANPQLFWFVWLAREPAGEAITAGREREYLTPLYQTFSANPISGAELDGYVCSFQQPGAMRAGFMLYRDESISAEQNVAAYTEPVLGMPLLAVGGEQSLGDFSAALEPIATDVRPVVVSGASHFLMSDKPEAITEILTDFFAGPVTE